MSLLSTLTSDPTELQRTEIELATELVEEDLTSATGNRAVCLLLASCCNPNIVNNTCFLYLQLSDELFGVVDNLLQSSLEELRRTQEESNSTGRYCHDSGSSCHISLYLRPLYS